MGAGHCFVFPSMVDLGAAELPPEHRGVGTSLILGAGDLGMLAGYFLLGEMIEAFVYETALACLAGAVFVGLTFFGISRRRDVFRSTPGTREIP